MKTINILTLLVLVSTTYACDSIDQKSLLGNWCASSADSFHESFELKTESGEGIFSSWLHQRPALSGTWDLQGATLSIYSDTGLDFVYSIDGVSPTKLMLREDGGSPEIYVRENCFEFEAPPM